jgi:hypothetical protein
LRNPPLCSLRELQDGTYSIDDLADMHEAIDLEEENQRRYENSRKTE